MSIQLVWFKRDLRIHDHEPLLRAASKGTCLGVFVYEPEILNAEDFDAAHLQFINESLLELRANLRKLGTELILLHGSLPFAFTELVQQHEINAIWAHEETTNQLAYQRDRRVRSWARANQIQLHEIPSNGVVRRLSSRNVWSKHWDKRMSTPILSPLNTISGPPIRNPGQIRDAQSVNVHDFRRTQLQRGGESHARAALDSFLHQRGQNYRTEMSSPVTAFDSCSRLSAHLAYGNLSIRTVFQATIERIRELKTSQETRLAKSPWLASLKSFQSRLHWHCHFIQKMEDQPSIEFENINRGFDGLREDQFDEAKFVAWSQGKTGFPMIDACMRALIRHGWVNFRMRAMLISFASYQLWLHWRRPALHLAKLFLDYEPGIHFSQIQMQSGVTGINTIRIYSPIKQVADQDPTGQFIRKYVPELSEVPDEFLAEPHKMAPIEQTWSRCRIGTDYPAPIVDHAVAYRSARDRIFEAKKSPAVREAAAEVYRKHGSRKQPLNSRR